MVGEEGRKAKERGGGRGADSDGDLGRYECKGQRGFVEK